jgi:uncharacterized protein YjbI with pentapeptide repeats
LLKQSVLRKEAEPGYDTHDLTGADLSTSNLAGANLRHVNLSNANLSDADLRRADLVGVNASGVRRRMCLSTLPSGSAISAND